MDHGQAETVLARLFPWLFATALLATTAIGGVRVALKRRRGGFGLRPALPNTRFAETCASAMTRDVTAPST